MANLSLAAKGAFGWAVGRTIASAPGSFAPGPDRAASAGEQPANVLRSQSAVPKRPGLPALPRLPLLQFSEPFTVFLARASAFARRIV
jgi:hypothetical protein